MHKVACVALWSVLVSACGHASQAASVPEVTIGACSRAEFTGRCEILTWPITGSLRGELRATLRHFADGKETIVAKATFAAEAMEIVGELVLLIRQGAPLASENERVVELRMPVRDVAKGLPVQREAADAANACGEPFHLPSSELRRTGLGADGVMRCVPNQSNVVELWSETHSAQPAGYSSGEPWSMSRNILLRDCVGGCETTVLTIEHELEPRSLPKPR